jgi:hypothetical protein
LRIGSAKLCADFIAFKINVPPRPVLQKRLAELPRCAVKVEMDRLRRLSCFAGTQPITYCAVGRHLRRNLNLEQWRLFL